MFEGAEKEKCTRAARKAALFDGRGEALVDGGLHGAAGGRGSAVCLYPVLLGYL